MDDVRWLRRLEEAGLNAWPALQTVLLDGWVLRFAGGYTKRANSINPTYPLRGAETETDLAARVAACEAIYAGRGLPPIFRLTSFGAPGGLDALLAARGYHLIDRTLVLSRARIDLAPGADSGDVRSAPLDRWLDRYTRFSGAALEKRDTHAAMLRQISGESLFGLLHDAGGEPVACGLAVREAGLVGLFDIVTDRTRRNQGHGRALVSALLAWARDRGAREAYLQVVATNEPAIRLYRALGFEDAYHYWYRVPPP